MDKKPKLMVDMLGVRFSLQADEDLAYLKSLVSYYEGYVKDALSYAKIPGNSDKLKSESAAKVAILAGVLTADRLYKEKKKSYILTNKVTELEKKLKEKSSSSLHLGKPEKQRVEVLVDETLSETQENSRLVQSLMSELESVLEES